MGIASALYLVESGFYNVTLFEKGDELQILVKDQGVGIPKEALPHVFERFYMGDTSLTRDKDSLGMGLTIAKYIVETHSGKIWARSEFGKGGEYAFSIPKVLDCPE